MYASSRGRALAAGVALSLSTGCAGEKEVAPTQGGRLDASFGAGGRVITDFGNTYSSGAALAVQADGKIVVAGYRVTDGPGYSVCFVLARYHADGSLDAGFGTGGQVTTPFEAKADAQAVAIQADGKIVAAGASSADGPSLTTLVRYNPDGSLDGGFGTGGKVITDFGDSGAQAVAIQADGKIVTAGRHRGLFALARYDPDGSLDSGFGAGGTVTTAVSSPTYIGSGDGVSDLAIQEDGKIVAAGSAYVATARGMAFALVRYNPDGSLDGPFGGSGMVITSIGSGGADARAVAIQADGKIVAAGSSWSIYDYPVFALARYDEHGRLDPQFGADGRVSTRVGTSDETAEALAIQADGKIVAVGWAHGDSPLHARRFALVRYGADGVLDPGFGTGGTVTTAFEGDGEARAVAIQADGKIVAAGDWESPVFPQFALVRYWP